MPDRGRMMDVTASPTDPSRSADATEGDQPTRRPFSVYGVGGEPDARFSMANERTALAWLRTGLGLVAGGVALTSLSSLTEMSAMIDIVAAIACIAGGIVAFYALVRWRGNERALRLGRVLPAPAMLPILVVGVVILALILAGLATAKLF